MSNNATICWTDIPVLDLDRAIAFYSNLLSEPVTKEKTQSCEFGLLPHANDRVSGCLCIQNDNKPSKSGPLIYLNVEGRLTRAIESVEKNGGELVAPKEQIGPWGFRAIIIDSEGNRVALHSYSDS